MSRRSIKKVLEETKNISEEYLKNDGRECLKIEDDQIQIRYNLFETNSESLNKKDEERNILNRRKG